MMRVLVIGDDQVALRAAASLAAHPDVAKLHYLGLLKEGSPEKALYDRHCTGAGSTFPQIFIGATHVGGCDELYALDRAGKLDALLAGEKASS